MNIPLMTGSKHYSLRRIEGKSSGGTAFEALHQQIMNLRKWPGGIHHHCSELTAIINFIAITTN
jgi:hypothetical protein